MPIGNFPMLQTFMQKKRKPGENGQQIPPWPMNAQPVAYNPNQSGMAKQQQFNEEQREANLGTVGGRMNRRRY